MTWLIKPKEHEIVLTTDRPFLGSLAYDFIDIPSVLHVRTISDYSAVVYIDQGTDSASTANLLQQIVEDAYRTEDLLADIDLGKTTAEQ